MNKMIFCNKTGYFNKDRLNKEKRSLEKGQAVLIAVIFFVFISLSMILALSAPALSYLKGSSSLYSSLGAFNAAESGAEDASYRFMNLLNVENVEVLSLDGIEVTVEYIENDDALEITSKAEAKDGNVRKVKSDLLLGDGIDFAYAVQVGNGGLILENSSEVEGNVFSNSFIEGSSNDINGSATVAGGGNRISGVNVHGSASAHRIEDSHVDEDAYYMEISNTTVMGNMYPNTVPSEVADFPISKETIEGWKDLTEEEGVINCSDTYVIDSDTTIGPVHITCDLEVKGNPTVTLGGHVWAEGDIEFSNSPTIKADDSLGDESVVFIADDPSDRINGSTISLGNSSTFQGADGSDKSFVFMVSENRAASEGQSTPAITDGQKATGDVFMYARKGEISVSNNINITGLTAYRIRAKNSATVVYQDGLADTFFSTGPSAGYNIYEWKEFK
ncbi:MAG: hypothetical protein ACQESA_00485 [Patescibacteria group bacterium]